MELIGFSRLVLGSRSTAEIRFIISLATRSVHSVQVSTTLLYFSPRVIRPSLYCCSYSRTSSLVLCTMASLVSGITILFFAQELPSRQHYMTPNPVIVSQQ